MFAFSSKNYAQNFFYKHQARLVANYPGLSLDIFWRNLNDYFIINSEDIRDTGLFYRLVLYGIPFEYILRRAYFYQWSFYVDERVLIPRMETELLLDMAYKEIKKRKGHLKVLDVGTGCGILAISLACLCPNLEILASDLSDQALEVAKINRFKRINDFADFSTVSFILCDRLTNIDGEFDFIISNPPYISTQDSHNVHFQVLKYEPQMALFLEEDSYYSWFKSFFNQVRLRLKTDGFFLMEGHENKLSQLSIIALDLGFTPKIFKDLTGRERFLKLVK